MTAHAQRAHAVYGASSAHRWFACPGSVRLCEGLPDVPSAAALEGTRAHELLEALLLGMRESKLGSDVHNRASRLWGAAPQDMRDAVHACVDYVRDILDDHPDAVLLTEHRFEIPVAAAPGEVFGTNDVCVFVPSLRLLYVVDYKHGDGVWVDVKGNKQLRFYALGALASCDVGFAQQCGAVGDIDTVCMTIVQPRHWRYDGPAEEWVSVEEILEFGPVIGEAITRCKAPDAPLVPGDQCQFCAARTCCPAREARAASAFDGVTDVALVEPRQLQVPGVMTGDRLSELLRAAPAIRAWFKDLDDEAERRLRAGEAVPGFKLVEAQARRQWDGLENDTNGEALMSVADRLAEIGGGKMEDYVVSKTRTLTEVEAILKQGCDRKEARRRLDAMAYLTTKKSSGALKVVPEEDSRPAAVLGSAFDGVVQVEDKRDA